MYTIEIDYTTGGTFKTEGRETNINLTFQTKDKARLALTYIKEHYKMYQAYNHQKNRNSILYKERLSEKEFYSTYKDKPWFYEKYPEYRILFEDSYIEVFWIGYFEILHGAKIILIDETEDEDWFIA